MRTGAIRISIIILAILLQISFFNFIFSKDFALDLMPLLVLAWVIIIGFEKAWPWVIVTGIFTDLAGMGKVGINVIFFILLAYSVSFFSKRFVIEKRFSGFIVISVFLVISLFVLDISRIIVSENFSIINTYAQINSDVLSWKKFVFQGFLNIIFFYMIYLIIDKIEKNISIRGNKIKIS